MNPSHEPISDPKVALRREVLARRKIAHAARGPAAAANVAERIVASIATHDKKIAGYWTLGDEIDCRPTLLAVAASGAHALLPVVAGQGHALIFRTWEPGDVLDPGPFGTAHPSPRSSVATPEILLLPLIAFDARGHRLGYGAGYYDRTVAALRTQRSLIVIGLSYEEQSVDFIPNDAHDQVMDAVVTDQRIIWFNAAVQDKVK